LLNRFQVVLLGFVTHPEQPISDLPLLTETETRQLLVDWNNTATDYPTTATIPQLFEAQAANTPDALALLFEDQQLTYAQLNQRANQLAHYLQRFNIGPETLVGLYVERS
jgi:non-ribosomal peptide synthetase component F